MHCTLRTSRLAWPFMMRTAISWIVRTIGVLMLLALSLGSFRPLRADPEHIAMGIAFLFWSTSAAFWLYGPLLKKTTSHLAFGCFMAGMATVLLGQAFQVFQSDPSSRFLSNGDRRSWFADLVMFMIQNFGPFGAGALFVAASFFLVWLAVMAFRDKPANPVSPEERTKGNEPGN